MHELSHTLPLSSKVPDEFFFISNVRVVAQDLLMNLLLAVTVARFCARFLCCVSGVWYFELWGSKGGAIPPPPCLKLRCGTEFGVRLLRILR